MTTFRQKKPPYKRGLTRRTYFVWRMLKSLSRLLLHRSPQPHPGWEKWSPLRRLLSHTGIGKAIQEQVRFARARFGTYELIDFVVVLIGYAVSGKPTLLAFYERLAPKASPFMALGGAQPLTPSLDPFPFSRVSRSEDNGSPASMLSRGWAFAQTVSLSWWLVRPDRSSVDRDRRRRDSASCPSTGAAADGGAPHTPSWCATRCVGRAIRDASEEK